MKTKQAAARVLTEAEQRTQCLYWRKLQLTATNQDEANEATEQMNMLLDDMLAKLQQR